MKKLGWLLFVWPIPNLIGMGIFVGENIKKGFLEGYEMKKKKGWRLHGFSLMFIFTVALAL